MSGWPSRSLIFILMVLQIMSFGSEGSELETPDAAPVHSDKRIRFLYALGVEHTCTPDRDSFVVKIKDFNPLVGVAVGKRPPDDQFMLTLWNDIKVYLSEKDQSLVLNMESKDEPPIQELITDLKENFKLVEQELQHGGRMLRLIECQEKKANATVFEVFEFLRTHHFRTAVLRANAYRFQDMRQSKTQQQQITVQSLLEKKARPEHIPYDIAKKVQEANPAEAKKIDELEQDVFKYCDPRTAAVQVCKAVANEQRDADIKSLVTGMKKEVPGHNYPWKK